MDATEQESATAPVPVARLEFPVEWPPKHVAAYLIEEPRPVLVDAGPPSQADESTDDDRASEGGQPSDDEPSPIGEELAAHGYDVADLAAAVVTHPHSDHIGQVPHLRDAGVPVYAPAPALAQLRRDADSLAEGVREVGRSIGLPDGEALEEQVDRAVGSLERDRRLLGPGATTGFPLDEPVEIAGLPFEPIHTPGHQLNHASLQTTIDGETVHFSGDTLIGPFRAAALHVGLDYGAYEAIEAFYASMDRYAGRDVDRVFPGHGPVFTDYEATVERTREKLDAVVDQTREATGAVGPATPMAIVGERVGEIEHPAALLDTLGALGTLEHRGEVTYDLEDGVRYYEIA